MGMKRHEERDMNVNAVAAFALSLTVFLVLIHFIVLAMFRHFSNRAALPHRPFAPRAVEPSSIVNPPQEMKSFQFSQEQQLNGYGWVDREHGIVHIPIERAMELSQQR
jgi:hypothetical protein